MWFRYSDGFSAPRFEKPRTRVILCLWDPSLNNIFSSRVQLLSLKYEFLLRVCRYWKISLLTCSTTLGSNWGRWWMKSVAPTVHGSIMHPKRARIQPVSEKHQKISDVFSCSIFLLTPKYSGLSYVIDHERMWSRVGDSGFQVVTHPSFSVHMGLPTHFHTRSLEYAKSYFLVMCAFNWFSYNNP